MKPSFQIEAQTGFWLTIQPTQVKNQPTDSKDRASETFGLYFYLEKLKRLKNLMINNTVYIWKYIFTR